MLVWHPHIYFPLLKFSTRSDFDCQRRVGNVWRHFLLPQLWDGVEARNAAKHPTTYRRASQDKNYKLKMSTVSGLLHRMKISAFSWFCLMFLIPLAYSTSHFNEMRKSIKFSTFTWDVEFYLHEIQEALFAHVLPKCYRGVGKLATIFTVMGSL